ncbi:site-2 protease family protein [Patescibacteria group bacterium]
MEAEIVLAVFQIMILIMSIVIHEVSHGYAALWLGDPTAKYAGRLTLNPIKHLDWWGSVFVPIIMITYFQFGFGWAKPVPYNPYNLKDQKNGPALVGLAGPASNIALALFFGLCARFMPMAQMVKYDIASNIFNFSDLSLVFSGSLISILFWLCLIIVTINVFLAFFNLIPIPPLDGSKLLFAFFPLKTEVKIILEQFGFVFLIMFMLLFSKPLGGALFAILSLFMQYVIGL